MTKIEVKIIAFIISFPISTITIGAMLVIIIESIIYLLGIPRQNVNVYSIWFYCLATGFVITAVQLFRGRKRLFKN